MGTGSSTNVKQHPMFTVPDDGSNRHRRDRVDTHELGSPRAHPDTVSEGGRSRGGLSRSSSMRSLRLRMTSPSASQVPMPVYERPERALPLIDRPVPGRFVNDVLGLLDEAAIHRLDQLCTRLYRQAGIPLLVATVSDIGLNDLLDEEAAIEAAKEVVRTYVPRPPPPPPPGSPRRGRRTPRSPRGMTSSRSRLGLSPTIGARSTATPPATTGYAAPPPPVDVETASTAVHRPQRNSNQDAATTATAAGSDASQQDFAAFQGTGHRLYDGQSIGGENGMADGFAPMDGLSQRTATDSTKVSLPPAAYPPSDYPGDMTTSAGLSEAAIEAENEYDEWLRQETAYREACAMLAVRASVRGLVPLQTDAMNHYANKLFHHWGIGEKQDSCGVLFLLWKQPVHWHMTVAWGEAWADKHGSTALLDMLAKNLISTQILPKLKAVDADVPAAIVHGLTALAGTVTDLALLQHSRVANEEIQRHQFKPSSKKDQELSYLDWSSDEDGEDDYYQMQGIKGDKTRERKWKHTLLRHGRSAKCSCYECNREQAFPLRPMQGDWFSCVIDLAGVLTLEDKAFMEKESKAMLNFKRMPIVVLTMPRLPRAAEDLTTNVSRGSLGPKVTDERIFASRARKWCEALFNEWGVGCLEFNRGVLMVLFAHERHVVVVLGKKQERRCQETVDTVARDTVVRSFELTRNWSISMKRGFQDIHTQIYIKLGVPQPDPHKPAGPQYAFMGGYHKLTTMRPQRSKKQIV